MEFVLGCLQAAAVAEKAALFELVELDQQHTVEPR